MRAFLWAAIVPMMLSSAALAVSSAECDYAVALSLPAPAEQDCSKGKVEDRLDCLARLIFAQKYEIIRLKCELEQMRTAKVHPLVQQGRVD